MLSLISRSNIIDMASVAIINDQNVVSRLTSLPLVSSTYDIMSKVYLQTKDQNTYLKTVLDVAELGVKTVTLVAMNSALPIIDILDPKLSITNDLACKGLDRIEKNLPILQQPSQQIVSTAKDAFSGAKESVTNAVTGMVGRVQGGVELTRAAVSGGVSTVTESRVVQLVSSGVDSVLTTSEGLVEQYLPSTNQEIDSSKAVECSEDGEEASSYYVRLGTLSVKLRQRAYQRAVAKIEYARKNIDGAHHKIQEKLSSIKEWRSNGHTPQECDAASVESRTLALARGLSHQLQTTCQGLVSGLQGLPQHVQDQALTITNLASEVCRSLSKAVALGDLSDGVLSSSRAQLHRLRETLDTTMDYLVNNTPLNWLVPDLTFSDLSSEPDMSSVQETETPSHSPRNMSSQDLAQK
ncbi:perilipin-2 isoform X3 [Clupea harengus]|uniref:Perilipin n=1 Tax=Clupea harengus TaxID=7950 RepID=A0A6P8GPC1_CLUHA|nr:perilipin-2 isoform X3 [Clupea harengus]